jgi:hypothetical protein
MTRRLRIMVVTVGLALGALGILDAAYAYICTTTCYRLGSVVSCQQVCS